MSEVKIVGRGVDTLVLNVSYADGHMRPLKQELADELQQELEQLQSVPRQAETAVVTHWSFKSFTLCMQPKGSCARSSGKLKSMGRDTGTNRHCCKGAAEIKFFPLEETWHEFAKCLYRPIDSVGRT